MSDNTVYRKVKNRYQPIGRLVNLDYLTEGVWVVHRHKYSRGYTNVDYLHEQYAITKASELQYPSVATLGGIEKIIGDIIFEELTPWREEKLRTTGVSDMECYRFVAGRLIEKLKEQSNEPRRNQGD